MVTVPKLFLLPDAQALEYISAIRAQPAGAASAVLFKRLSSRTDLMRSICIAEFAAVRSVLTSPSSGLH